MNTEVLDQQQIWQDIAGTLQEHFLGNAYRGWLRFLSLKDLGGKGRLSCSNTIHP